MSSSQYITGRKKYSRPQAMLWSNFEPIVSSGIFVPEGFEVGQETDSLDPSLLNSFLILSDDGRQKLDFSFDRIEQRERMVNGRMRSYHIADKLSLSTSWTMLPSRSFATSPDFDVDGATALADAAQFTSDNGAGGVDILNWYESHTGPFWVYLAYDKHSNFSDENKYSKLGQYNEAIQMYVVDFSYSVVKRGASNHDFWDISITLEEV